MLPASELCNFRYGEARQAVMDVFNAVSQWRDEISLANDRYVAKVLDLVVAAQKAQGWPNSVTEATREHLLRASKVQTQMINQLMSGRQHRLTSKFTLPHASTLSMTSTNDPVSEVMRLGEMTLTPFKIWLSAAETWQRTWAEALRSPTDGHLLAPIKSAA